MRKTVCLILILALCLTGAIQAYAVGIMDPVIEGQMPDCYGYLGDEPVELFTNASSPDGGTLVYQWYQTSVNDISTIIAIQGAEGVTYTPPAAEGVTYYCYAVWNTHSGAMSDPVYSRLIRVEYAYAPVPSSIEIVRLPNKTVYELDEELDMTGLQVRVCLQDGTVLHFQDGKGEFLEITPGMPEPDGMIPVQVAYVNGLGSVDDMFYMQLKHTHVFGQWMVTTEPTCTEEGIKARECDCGYTERAGVPATGHKFGDWMVTTEPTCTEEGIKARECDCGHTEREGIPATGHRWDAGKVTKEPTETSDGERLFTCTQCQKTRTEVIPAAENTNKPNGKPSGDPKEDTSTPTPAEEKTKAERADLNRQRATGFPGWATAVITTVGVTGISSGIAIVLKKKKRNH